MSFSVPISVDDVGTLPDNTALIENLATEETVTTVLPRFLGTGEEGRFVSAFFVFHADRVTLYCRLYQSEGESSLTKTDSISLTTEPTVIGDLWDQTIFIEDADMQAIDLLKQRSEYETWWLSFGQHPEEPFEALRDDDPFEFVPNGLPECSHESVSRGRQVPNLDIVVVPCAECGIPLHVATDEGLQTNYTLLREEFLDVDSTGGEFVGIPVLPEGKVSNAELTLHLLTRFANVEQEHLDLYTRHGRLGMAFVHEEVAKGYVLWDEYNEIVALQQIYVLPQYRREGWAERFVEHWFEQVDCESYFAVEPNPAARAVHESIDHLSDGTARPATVLSCRDTLDLAEISSGYADKMQ